MVFQSYALYPHMTVAQNIGFPLKMVGHAAGRDRRRPWRTPPARSTSGTCSIAGPGSFRAASSSAARWRARSCASRGCSCSTSRCRTSTRSCAWRRGSSCAAAARARRHRGVRDARPGRGDDAGRPHGRVHGRAHRAGRHAAGDLRAAGARVGGRLHRHAADEPAAGQRGTAARGRSTAPAACAWAAASAERARSRWACGPATCASRAERIAARVERVEELGDSRIVNFGARRASA